MSKFVGVPDAQIVTGRDWIDLAYARPQTAWGYWALGTMLWRAEDPYRSMLKDSMVERTITMRWIKVEKVVAR